LTQLHSSVIGRVRNPARQRHDLIWLATDIAAN